MRSIKLLALGLAAIAAASCGDRLAGTLPVGPTALEQGSVALSAASLAPLDESNVPPLVVPEGISCPSDAPIVMIGSFGTRIDIEWSAIPRVTGYEVAIEARQENGDWSLVHQGETTRVREEWNGRKGFTYRARVRSRVCGGFGQWSSYRTQTIDRDPEVKAPQPPVTPPCHFASSENPCVPNCNVQGVLSVRGEQPCGEPPCQMGSFTSFGFGCERDRDDREPECERGFGPRSERGNDRRSNCEPDCRPQFGPRGFQDGCDSDPCDTGRFEDRNQRGSSCSPCDDDRDNDHRNNGNRNDDNRRFGPRGVEQCESRSSGRGR